MDEQRKTHSEGEVLGGEQMEDEVFSHDLRQCVIV